MATQITTIDCHYVRHTLSGLCIKTDRDLEVWLPFSKIEHDFDLDDVAEGASVQVHVPVWLAEREGLV